MSRATLSFARTLASLATLVTLVTLGSVARADVARCGKCSASGADLYGGGGLAALMVAGGATALFIGRGRRRPRS